MSTSGFSATTLWLAKPNEIVNHYQRGYVYKPYMFDRKKQTGLCFFCSSRAHYRSGHFHESCRSLKAFEKRAFTILAILAVLAILALAILPLAILPILPLPAFDPGNQWSLLGAHEKPAAKRFLWRLALLGTFIHQLVQKIAVL